MKKEKAAISLFLIIILIATVSLGGMFIDLSRVLVAKNKVRTATESAVRSTLAGYSEDLVSEWGLFAFKATSGDKTYQEDFNRYLELNLSTKVNDAGAGAGLIDYEIIEDKTSISCSKPLSDKAVFAEKINEYEKYRAPVNLTIGVVEKFKSVFSGNKNAIASLNITDSISGFKDKMKNSFSGLSGVSSNFNSQVDNAGVGRNGEQSDGKLGEVNTDNFSSLKSNIDQDIERSKGLVKDYGSSLEEYKNAGDTANAAAEEIKSTAKTKKGTIDTEGEQNSTDDFETGRNTYETIPEDTEANKSKMNAESQKLNETIKKTEDAETKAYNLQKEVNKEIDDAKKLADEYNDIVKQYNLKTENLNIALQSHKITIPNSGVLSNIPSLQAAMHYDMSNMPTVKDVLSYDNSDKISQAKIDVEKKKNELSNKISELISKQKKAKSSSEINSANDKASKMRQQLIAFKNISQNMADNDKKLIIEDDMSQSENLKKYSYIDEYFSNYYSDKQNIDKNMDDFINDYEAETEKYEKEAYDMSKNSEEIQNVINEISNILVTLHSKEYIVKDFISVPANSSSVTEIIKLKKDAEKKYAEYEKQLNTIKEINTKNKIGISDENGNTTITDFDSFAMSNVEEDEEDKFEPGELFSMAKTIKYKIQQFTRVMPSYKDVLEKELEASGKNISMFNELKTYFQQISDTLNNEDILKDKFYLVDYVMSKCTYLTSQTPRQHYFQIGEVEYIIYGKSRQIDNIIAAVTQVTMLRFAINTINYFLTSVDGELISRVIISVVRGVIQTVKDMTDMLISINNGNDKGLIALCPSLSQYRIVSYSDHLRILLLMKLADDGGAGALRRCIQATMGDEYGEARKVSAVSTDYLGEYYTEVNATTTVDINLLFIPLFFPDSINIGPLHDGKYEIVQKFTYGY